VRRQNIDDCSLRKENESARNEIVEMAKLRLSLSSLSRAGSFSSAIQSSLKDGMNDNMLTRDGNSSKGRSPRRLIPPPFRRLRKQNTVVVTESSRIVPFVPLFPETAATSSLDRTAPDDQTTTVLSACGAGASFLPHNADAEEKRRLRAEVESLKRQVNYLSDELDSVLASKEDIARKLDKIVKKRNSDQQELLDIRGMLTDDTDSTGYTDESPPFFHEGLCLSCGAGGD